MQNTDDLTPPDDDFKPGEILSPQQHSQTAEELTAMMQQLKAVASTAIADIQRCRDMLEAEGQYKKAADLTIKLLPYVMKKKGELDEIAEGSLFATFNINIVTKRDTTALDYGAALYREASDLPHNLATLDAAHALALHDLYHQLTGSYSVNGERLLSPLDIERSVLIKYGHHNQAKLI
ncbi:hypothetical protein NMN79_004462 [Salmonella enterica]|nr:hypothetical protein [Salmonella enterica]